MGGINHQMFRSGVFIGKIGKNPVKNAQLTPPDKAVVQGLVRSILPRRITPAKAIAQHKNDP